MDGVPHVTQPPVEPGGSFTYEFTPKDAGTFWFHPHVRSSEQVERGLYGVLIVEDPTPSPYARDVVWVLDDWLLDETAPDLRPLQHAPRPDARRALGQLRHRQRPHGHGAATRAAASGSACACSTPRTGASSPPNSRGLDRADRRGRRALPRAPDPARAVRAGAGQPPRPGHHASGRAAEPVAGGGRSVLRRAPQPSRRRGRRRRRPAPDPSFPSPAHARVPTLVGGRCRSR